jgi:hypothetical protein
MNFLDYQSHIKVLLKNYRSCSLVNSDGSLLFSKDLQPELLTTTRLVAFQIVKKYLNPKPKDFFILNDPENGGYQFSKLIFISCLDPNLFVIWDEDYAAIDFKIPPTQLYDRGVKNEFVWQALISPQTYAAELESFFEYQKYNIDRILALKEPLNAIAHLKNQQMWLKTTQEIFSIQFDNKAHGSFEGQFRLSASQCIKLKFSAEERQNLKLITLDFTNTSLATDQHASSHVIESALIKKIIDYYQIGDFFTQAILDKIKVMLPPKSIVSKPHPTGECNYELQAICQQLCDYNIQQLNSHSRKPQSVFEYINFLNFQLYSEGLQSNSFISTQANNLNEFESFVVKGLIQVQKMRKHENTQHIIFKISSSAEIKLRIINNYQSDKADMDVKINSKSISRGTHILQKDDLVEIVSV